MSVQPLLPPSKTVYIRNLEENVKLPTLKKSLEAIFSTYGRIEAIIAHSNIRMRGQAFVVFAEAESAERAVRDVQSFPLFEKPMVLNYAKTPSDVTVVKSFGEQSEEFGRHKEERLARKEAYGPLKGQHAQTKESAVGRKVSARGTAAASATGSGPARMHAVDDAVVPPNRILFLEQLPSSATQEVLTAVFSRFAGLVEVRMVPGRPGIAFVEYDSEDEAAIAKTSTSGMSLEGKTIKVNYAKR